MKRDFLRSQRGVKPGGAPRVADPPAGPAIVGPEEFTTLLAVHVMGWEIGPDRYLMGRRRWSPRWRFQPLKRLEDAFRVLNAANPDEYTIHVSRGDGCSVRVRLGRKTVEHHDASQPRAISLAIAAVMDLDVESGRSLKGRAERA
jgi:hypothetical protein